MGSSALIGINVHNAPVRYQTTVPPGGSNIWTDLRCYADVRLFSGGVIGARKDLPHTRTGYPNVGETYHIYMPCFLAGTHEIEWTGDSAGITVNSTNGGAPTVIANKITLPGLVVSTTAFTLRMTVTASISALTIRNVAHKGPVIKYNTDAIDYYKIFKVLRLMTAANTNETPTNDFLWAADNDELYMSYYENPFGVPIDEQVNIINHISTTTGVPCHGWFCMHDTIFTKDTGSDAADWLNELNSLDTGNIAYIELSNEPWNNPQGSDFFQSQRFQADGIANADLDPPVASTDFKRRMMQYAIYSATMADQAAITVTTPTFEVILNGQASNNGTIKYLDTAPHLTGTVGDVITHVAIAPYIGNVTFPSTGSVTTLFNHLFADFEDRWEIGRDWQKTLSVCDTRFSKTSVYEVNDNAKNNHDLANDPTIVALLKTHSEALISGNNPLTTETFRPMELFAWFAGDGSGSTWDTEENKNKYAMLNELIGVAVPPDPAPDPMNPTADAGPDQTVQPLSTATTFDVTLDGSASVANEPGETLILFEWFPLPAGTPTPASVVNPTVSLLPGTHTFDLMVTDSDTPGNISASDRVEIIVEAVNVIPVANAGVDQNPIIPTGSTTIAVTLDGSASTDSDGTIVSYQWSGEVPIMSATATTVVNLGVGTHDYTLVVVDDDGEVSVPTSASATQIIVEQAPVIPPPPPTPVGAHPTGWIHASLGNLPLKPVDHYDTIKVLSGIYYDQAKITDGAATKNLHFEIYRPDDVDNMRQIPVILWVANVGYTSSPFTNAVADVHCDKLASMGCVVMSVETRIESEDPYNIEDVAGDSDITKAIRAAIRDISRALEFIRNNPLGAGFYNINQDLIFLGGNDTAFMTCMQYVLNLSGAHGLAGMIGTNAAFGFGSTWTGDQVPDTTDLRAFQDETNWDNTGGGKPPVCWINGDSDTYLGTTETAALKAKLDLDSANTTVLVVGENHTDPDTWTLPDSGTTWDTFQTFVAAIVANTADRTTRVTFT